MEVFHLRTPITTQRAMTKQALRKAAKHVVETHSSGMSAAEHARLWAENGLSDFVEDYLALANDLTPEEADEIRAIAETNAEARRRELYGE